MKWALWDMGTASPDHDILIFVHAAKKAGADAIWFKKGFNHILGGVNAQTYVDEASEATRHKSILFEGCDLYGMPYEVHENAPKEHVVFKGHARPGLINQWSEFLPKIIPEEALERAREKMAGRKLVVSIRNAVYNQLRNSSPDWHKWAADHDAYIVKDFLDEKTTLAERAAVYELADLHYGVMQGPMVLSWLSKKPYLIIKMICHQHKVSRPDYYEMKFKMKVGKQFENATPAQKMVWNDQDDYATIEREYQAYLNGLR